MKLYLVIADAYYDWSVAGVFSTREKAADFLQNLSAKEHYGIEEYVLDEMDEE